ncbi:MAG: outer membrane protein assembly factor BamD [Phycisphaerales bacterium]
MIGSLPAHGLAPRPLIAVAALLCIAAHSPGALAQGPSFTLERDGRWAAEGEPEPGSDAAVIADVRRHLAEDRPGAAFDRIDRWIKQNDPESQGTSPWLPEAYLARGDALLAMNREFKALFDYEVVASRFPQSSAFVRAIERELGIARLYSAGLKRRLLGIRWGETEDTAIELMVRAQERMPGSVLAEQAAIDLADHYFRKRDMALAAEAYDLYLLNYPQGPNRIKAMQRRIFSTIAQFKGPSYDSSSLLDAELQIRRFAVELPTEAERLGIDDALLARVDESLAVQRLDTAKWRLRQGDLASGRFLLRRVVKDHPRSTAAGEAIQMMTARGWLLPDEADEPDAAGAEGDQ